VKVLKWLDKNFERYLLNALLLLISVLLMFQVIMRYVFKNALAWPEELSRYAFVLSVFLSMSYCTRINLIFKLDFISSKLPLKLQKILDIIIWIITIVFFSYLLYYSFNVVNSAMITKQLSTALGMPISVLYSFTTLGFILTIIRSIQYLFDIIKSFNNKQQVIEFDKEVK
jgi:TRAP-type C4-dicarboxylate transport system permease small subunit